MFVPPRLLVTPVAAGALPSGAFGELRAGVADVPADELPDDTSSPPGAYEVAEGLPFLIRDA